MGIITMDDDGGQGKISPWCLMVRKERNAVLVPYLHTMGA